MIDLDTLQLHDVVTTPDGAGVYQGKIIKNGEAVCLLVSLPKSKSPSVGKHRGVWWLTAYPLEQVFPYEYKDERKSLWNNNQLPPPTE